MRIQSGLGLSKPGYKPQPMPMMNPRERMRAFMQSDNCELQKYFFAESLSLLFPRIGSPNGKFRDHGSVIEFQYGLDHIGDFL